MKTILKIAELSGPSYWRYPFRCLANCKQLVEYVVMNIDHVKDSDTPHVFPRSDKHVLADVWLVKSSELGISEEYIHTKTHLGHILNVGDSVLAFDVANANLNEDNFEKYESSSKAHIPDIIIVKKFYGDKVARNRKRQWKLRRLQIDEMSQTSSADREFIDFMEDLEEDPMSRQNVNIYKDNERMKSYMAVDVDELDNENTPTVTLQEMLDDLTIDE